MHGVQYKCGGNVLTTTEASLILRLKPKTITRYIERGLITADKKGRDYLISEEEISRFKKDRKSRGKPSKQK